MTIELGDGQLRRFFLRGENLMMCFFYVDNKQTGWCLWCKRNDKWFVDQASRGEGGSIAKPSFGEKLDYVYTSLVLEMELGL